MRCLGVLPSLTGAQPLPSAPASRITLLVGFWGRECAASYKTVGSCSKSTEHLRYIPEPLPVADHPAESEVVERHLPYFSSVWASSEEIARARDRNEL